MADETVFVRVAQFGAALALVVIVLGAFVRLSNAGLSCPDWPGCYGKVLVPESPQAIAAANQAFPDRPVDVPRAWKEMVHRYLAAALGLAILLLAWLAWSGRQRPGQMKAVPLALVGLVIFQGALGMWTVTLLLKPIVVTAHLLGGFTTLLMLWWVVLRQGRLFVGNGVAEPVATRWIVLGGAMLYVQITLGGWTSANYAALACPDFPTCQGAWFPALSLSEALTPWHGLGQNYEGGILDNQARVTIHVLHRVGALLVTSFLVWLGYRLLRFGPRRVRPAVITMLAVLGVQIGLGISNVVLHLPIEVAVAHNGVAALLLLATATVYHVARPPTGASPNHLAYS